MYFRFKILIVIIFAFMGIVVPYIYMIYEML